MHPLTCTLSLAHRAEFKQLLAAGDRDVVYSVIKWVLSQGAVLEKRAFVGFYLSFPDVSDVLTHDRGILLHAALAVGACSSAHAPALTALRPAGWHMSSTHTQEHPRRSNTAWRLRLCALGVHGDPSRLPTQTCTCKPCRCLTSCFTTPKSSSCMRRSRACRQSLSPLTRPWMQHSSISSECGQTADCLKSQATACGCLDAFQQHCRTTPANLLPCWHRAVTSICPTHVKLCLSVCHLQGAAAAACSDQTNGEREGAAE